MQGPLSWVLQLVRGRTSFLSPVTPGSALSPVAGGNELWGGIFPALVPPHERRGGVRVRQRFQKALTFPRAFQGDSPWGSLAFIKHDTVCRVHISSQKVDTSEARSSTSNVLFLCKLRKGPRELWPFLERWKTIISYLMLKVINLRKETVTRNH